MFKRYIRAFVTKYSRFGLRYSFDFMLPPPQIVFFSLTSLCNMHCIMCDIGKKNERSQFYKNLTGGLQASNLDMKEARPALETIARWRSNVVICGAEPLLYIDLAEFIRFFGHHKIPVDLITNGYFLFEQAEDLLEADLSTLHVSLDGLGATHNSIRGIPDAYETAKRGLRRILTLREKMNKNITVDISFTITHLNYHELGIFYQEVSAWGVDRVTFFFPDFITKEMADRQNSLYGDLYRDWFHVEPNNLSAEEINQISIDVLHKEIEKIWDKKEVYFLPAIHSKEDIRLYFVHHDRFIKRDYCHVPWKIMLITPKGDVVPDCRCFNIILGNIYSQTLEAIWHGEPYRHFRSFLRKMKAFPVCTRCCAIHDFK